MPAMAPITVKMNNGTTDIVYSNLAPSGGDKIAAIWSPLAMATTAAYRAVFRFASQFNGDRTARKCWAKLDYPSVATENTVLVLKGRIIAESNWTLPVNVSDADINEAVSQYANLLVSTLIKDSCKQGYAPN